MFQRNTAYIPRLRSCLRLLTPFLYLCLIISLTWYEANFSAPMHSAAMPPAVTGHLSVHSGFTLSQKKASHRLPSLLASAPKLPSGTRLRPENRDDEPIPLQLSWDVASARPCLSPPRIDPVAWDSGTPSFLLPSAYGLVPFAIPPPSRLV